MLAHARGLITVHNCFGNFTTLPDLVVYFGLAGAVCFPVIAFFGGRPVGIVPECFFSILSIRVKSFSI